MPGRFCRPQNRRVCQSGFYRSDIHAVAAASVVAESVIAIQLASEILFCGCENMEYLEKRIKTLVDI